MAYLAWITYFLLCTATSTTMALNCQPPWKEALTICLRVVHSPRSFWVSKEWCAELGGTLLSLNHTQQVFEALGDSMVGNVLSEYRIDGWSTGQWFQGQDEPIPQDNSWTFSQQQRARTLTMDLEDGTISGKHGIGDLLGFVCQATEIQLAGGKECPDTPEQPSNSEEQSPALAGPRYVVIGGSPEEASRNVEVLQFSPSASQSCMPIPTLPFDGVSRHMSAFIGGKLAVCGGKGSEYCHTYEERSDRWNSVNFNTEMMRELSLSIVAAPEEWWLAGGMHGSSVQGSNLVYTGSRLKPVQPYVQPIAGACALAYNATHIFFSGGYVSNGTVTAEAHLMEWSTKTVTKLEDMLVPRAEHACGLVNGDIVVVGGAGEGQVTLGDSEVFSGVWTKGPNLPESLGHLRGIGSASVQLESEDTFAILGGEDQQGWSNKILKFDGAESKWQVLDQKLSMGRTEHTVTAVPANFNC